MQSDAGPPVSVFQKPSLDEDSKLLPSDEVVQVASQLRYRESEPTDNSTNWVSMQILRFFQECLSSHLDTSNKAGALEV